MPKQEWNIVRKKHPPVNKPFWGAELFYGGVFLCQWDGENTCDDGTPFCNKVDNEHDDDMYIFAWTPAEVPKYPTLKAHEYGDDYEGHENILG
jgi:hypothetical protein